MTTPDVRPDARTLGLGIVGCGGAAADVIGAVASVPTWRCTGVMLPRPRRRRGPGPLRRAGRDTRRSTTLLAADAVQAVYVAVPHDLLAPIAAQVLEAGRHALVEKPMALSLDDAR